MDEALVIVGPNRLGEGLFATGPIERLHAARPDLSIVVLTGPLAAEVMETSPAVAATVAVDRRPLTLMTGFYSRAAAKALGAVLEGLGLDPALARLVALRDQPSYRDLARRLRASFMVKDVTGPPFSGHRTQRIAQALAPFGVEPPRGPIAAQIHLSLADEEVAERALAGLELDPKAPLVVLHPGSRERAGGAFARPGPSREWGAARYVELARALGLMGHAVVVTANGWAEERLAAEVASGAGSDGRVRVAPAVPVRALASLLRRAAAVVSNDSGPLHLAAAVGTPVVGIYGPTDPTETGPVAPPERCQVFAPPSPGACDAAVPLVAQAVRRLVARRVEATRR